ncbi:hypothetical protein ACFTY8_15080 [Streptomyces mirabilis]|uniref:hypothetical protein n=1 Tax=Streptomyces mirabilis TaxID=68239 RepID=UPI00362B39F9
MLEGLSMVGLDQLRDLSPLGLVGHDRLADLSVTGCRNLRGPTVAVLWVWLRTSSETYADGGDNRNLASVFVTRDPLTFP